MALHLLLLLFAVPVLMRTITFINSCPFNLSVQESGTTVVCIGLASNSSCVFDIPTSGWSGNFHRQNPGGEVVNYGYPSATLAEMTLANNVSGQYNFDWFDISIIPPGCGSLTSYNACWCSTGNDGYDVGMSIRSSACPSKDRTCLNRGCTDAYGYSSDNSKTTVCTNITGSWEVEFCPQGSYIDVPPYATYEVPPCISITSTSTAASTISTLLSTPLLLCVGSFSWNHYSCG